MTAPSCEGPPEWEWHALLASAYEEFMADPWRRWLDDAVDRADDEADGVELLSPLARKRAYQAQKKRESRLRFKMKIGADLEMKREFLAYNREWMRRYREKQRDAKDRNGARRPGRSDCRRDPGAGVLLPVMGAQNHAAGEGVVLGLRECVGATGGDENLGR